MSTYLDAMPPGGSAVTSLPTRAAVTGSRSSTRVQAWSVSVPTVLSTLESWIRSGYG